MTTPLHILHLEDNPRDAELIQEILETEGIVSHVTRVETQADFIASLDEGGFDLIFADYSLPSFDGLSALKIVLQKCPDVPFIFVSGTLGEEVAIESLKLGATDYVIKNRLSRLVPSVQRALREAEERTQRKRAEEKLRDARARFEGIVEIAQDAIISVDSHQSIILFNQGAEKVFGYTQAEVIGRSLDLLLPRRFEDVHRKHIEDFTRSPDVARTMGQRREVSGRRKDGSEFPAEASISKLDLGSELVFTVILRDITERKRAEDALRESEAKLEEAQRLTHVGYWDRDMVTDLITWSDETYRIYGVPSEERILTLDRIQELIHPEDRPIMLEAVSAALGDGPRYDVEYRVIQPNGGVRIVHSQADVTRDESGRPRRVFGTVQDITERKRAEQRLVVQHTLTQILAEAATLQEATPKILETVCACLAWDVGALWRIDREASVLRCVELWHKESLEVPEFEATSRARTILTGTGLPGRVWSSRELAYIPDVVHDPSFFRAPIAAREGLHAALAFPILLGGQILGVLEFFSREIRQPDQDLLDMMATIGSQIGQFIERKRAEESLRSVQMELAHVTRVATLGEMAASIAHEINQPLGAVVNNANACLRWLVAQNVEEARRSAELIRADGHRAGEIIQRIRSFAKNTPPQKDWININQTIREVIALARSEIQRNGVALKMQLPDDVQHAPLVFADRIQLQQVILNLIMNAVEAMSENGDGPRELLIRTGTDESGTTVAVRDAGPGLPPENLDRLFTPFYTTKPQGMGMGLAICRSIVEAHGGRLWATVNEDRGATFQFTLPNMK
jgi:PAS domain S-box-containing protein